ncbi:hypothetical protein A2739_01495 [Candidatus Giovannonibacteria bacterium RIFCSPHIGHO2_01_FULL_43_100]|uniref:Uncharacterized protein n=1 Tax=Candidatus Giovannonibacteria bacterium RIFCSPHIGHO2_12_FULL_43_15 TaxID=1798341 RepID=A0A1F5WR29_9BACT|nr:MAG: hypothetical protein A2739_01495 [Candidatus Giovannonibacteria bacterium RIFCSPHIGHO2_01_FULL_43_100]OGF66941.1 MAG: hypothetical protein A3B97_03640 [Candidatus Giovannonibacteria bacterium RIFCSPHIGHO2_02_FULL_43_32]OGF78123.1 MAG: hypothetical protein A3F23_02895 [Candidatus Giovannonibacteria bacterium RIFCSPHIGHO2_12_FULL_43_15]OGF78530.1 MAG: hypothetical protein A3A15_02795 [Candidatus Giovannonibacteria bacterium RIFCSPLOWO2_01_FULL_43_60]
MSEKSPENLENNPAPKSPESELSPEVLDGVMGKIDDIFEYGTAYTAITAQKNADPESVLGDNGTLEKVLKHGVIGTSRSGEISSEETKPEPAVWHRKLKEKKQVTVSFNIQGRSFRSGQIHSKTTPPRLHELYLQEKEYHHFYNVWHRGISIVFDISNLKEIPPQYVHEKSHPKPFPPKTFGIRGGRSHLVKTPDERGNLCTTIEYGFSLQSRISPRQIRGMILSPQYENQLSLVIDKIKKNYEETSENLIPAYNESGDLLWPKQMSYEEVKRFVAERDKNKKEEK